MAEKFDIRKALGAGTEGISESVLGLPFIDIIQGSSPEIKVSHPKHAQKKIAGAVEGDIMFAPESRILPRPLVVIPTATTTVYTEWRPQSIGGGIVGHQPLSISSHPAYTRGKKDTPDANKEWLGKNELKLTTYFSVLFQSGETWKTGLIAMSSTQLKHARVWSKAILGVKAPYIKDGEQAPIFAAKWRLSTGPENNDRGGWMGWIVSFDSLLDLETDQALMEQAFTAYQTDTAKLPAPAEQPVAALTDSTAAGPREPVKVTEETPF